MLLAGGCESRHKPVPAPVERVWESPAAPPAADGRAGHDVPSTATTQPARADASESAETARPAEIIAVVNGSPIWRSDMVETLLESHGLRLLEELILLTAARQRAAEKSLTVSREDLAAAHEDALRQLSMPIGESGPQSFDRQTAQRLLQEFLVAKNISPGEWDCRMQQRAYLRKIAEAEVANTELTEGDLRKEYARAYGERVQIRHIQVSSLAAAARARTLLTEKKDFELVARQLSENQITAARGGLMPPFTRHDPSIPPLIREAAFGLKVGQTTPALHEDNWYHIIRLERRFPASGVGFDNVDRADLRRRLVDRLVRQRQQSLEAELFQSATVDIRNDRLNQQFRKKHRGANR